MTKEDHFNQGKSARISLQYLVSNGSRSRQPAMRINTTLKWAIGIIIAIITLGIGAYYHLDNKKLEEKLFLVEKRPRINFSIEKLDGKYLNSSVKKYATSTFSIRLFNEGVLPARSIKANVYLFNELDKQVQFTILDLGNDQLLASGIKFINPSISSNLVGDDLDKVLKLGKLKVQIDIYYKSDANNSIEYSTSKIFLINKDEVTTVGGLGDFR